MRYILALLLCALTFDINAQQEEYDQLLNIQNISGLEACIMSFPEIYQNTNETDFSSHLIGKIAEPKNLFVDSFSSPQSLAIKQYANAVFINLNGGYTYHVADYYGAYGSSRVVTCLDGPLKGLQGIADNGVKMIESNEVKWHKGYFEHRYPNAKVISFPSSQYFELK